VVIINDTKDINNNNLNALKDLLYNGIISSTDDIKALQDIMKREEYLDRHPYKIWHGRDGKWYTKLVTKEGKRIQRSRNTKRELQDWLIDYYKDMEVNPTIEELFDEWLDKKVERNEIQNATRDRYKVLFNTYIRKIGNVRIKSVNKMFIEDYAKDTIYSKDMNMKQFNNLRTVLNGIFHTAYKKDCMDFKADLSVKELDISKKAFSKPQHDLKELIFFKNEVQRIEGYCKRHIDIRNLGILLYLKSGMRPGELTALKQEDIGDNVIHVHRTQVSYRDENGKWVYTVRDSPKTEKGIRDIVIPTNCVWILESLKELNPSNEFVFSENGKRLTNEHLRTRLRYICRHLKIEYRSLNKFRKTYASTLIDSGVSDTFITTQMGHNDIKTTLDFYYKDRSDIEERTRIINTVVGL